MDVRFADEVRDDLLLSMAWMDERRDGLGANWKRSFMPRFRSSRIVHLRLLRIILDTARAGFVVSPPSFTIALNLKSLS